MVLLRFIDELVEAYRLDPEQVYLMGFSQGASLGLRLALTRPDKLAGVAAISGMLLPELLPPAVPPEALEGLPVFLTHGTADPVVPSHRPHAGRDSLANLPVALTYREYLMGHELGDESVRDAAAWLKERLDERGVP
jgi:phospholipase/carboxylesterase